MDSWHVYFWGGWVLGEVEGGGDYFFEISWINFTYNFKHCDLVHLQGFLGLTPEASNETCADEVESRRSPWLIFEELIDSRRSMAWFDSDVKGLSSFILTRLK